MRAEKPLRVNAFPHIVTLVLALAWPRSELGGRSRPIGGGTTRSPRVSLRSTARLLSWQLLAAVAFAYRCHAFPIIGKGKEAV